ncbi:DUF805 domain-containing protein [Mesorhizobium sp. M0938]|uniref:DUF805 domain-containing protein n=1 Tax=unclassified Mesorhizobium TaxID=325217 RepID=UPI00333968CC
MRGTVYHYDQDQGFGYINGVDGKRYIVGHEDLSPGVVLVRGAPVEFQPDDGTARAVIAGGPSAAESSSLIPRGVEPAQSTTGLWTYFWRAFKVRHVSFTGRARRKEFWGFLLFTLIVFFALVAFGLLIDAAITAIGGDVGALGYAPAFVFLLLTVLPWFALMVRRLHDIGLSGWFVLLYFVPGFNTLGVLALGLIPSKVGENPWGPVPAGVRI